MRALMIIVGLINAIALCSQTSPIKCINGTSDVRITGQQLRISPPSYRFVVSNSTNSPILSVIIGEATKPELRGSQMNIPLRMESPDGWTGTQVFREESPYMYYWWNAKNMAKGILPQQSSCNFRIDLPSIEGLKPQVFGDGKPAVQVDFKDIPFRVDLANGAIYCGTISVDFIRK